jgi:hypothetical protein
MDIMKIGIKNINLIINSEMLPEDISNIFKIWYMINEIFQPHRSLYQLRE